MIKMGNKKQKFDFPSFINITMNTTKILLNDSINNQIELGIKLINMIMYNITEINITQMIELVLSIFNKIESPSNDINDKAPKLCVESKEKHYKNFVNDIISQNNSFKTFKNTFNKINEEKICNESMDDLECKVYDAVAQIFENELKTEYNLESNSNKLKVKTSDFTNEASESLKAFDKELNTMLNSISFDDSLSDGIISKLHKNKDLLSSVIKQYTLKLQKNTKNNDEEKDEKTEGVSEYSKILTEISYASCNKIMEFIKQKYFNKKQDETDIDNEANQFMDLTNSFLDKLANQNQFNNRNCE
eukprot:292310_1